MKRDLSRREILAIPLAALIGKGRGSATGTPAAATPAVQVLDPGAEVRPQAEIEEFDFSFLPPADLTFALVADTHTDKRPTSATPTAESFAPELLGAQARHDLNDPRTAKVYAQLNANRPSFVIHLGDLVHGHPRDNKWNLQVKKTRGLLRLLRMHTYLVPGNHDIGNKLSAILPKNQVPPGFYYVSSVNIRAYERAFGRSFFHFEKAGNLFLVLNAQAFNSGLPGERRQWQWLEETLAASRDHDNVFLCMHVLPYWARADEPGEGNYEVIDEPARSRLMALVAEHDVRAVFAGHIHHDYVRYHGSTLIAGSPSTSFSRDNWGLYYPRQPPTWDPARAAYCYVRTRGRKVVRQLVRTVELLPPVPPCQQGNTFAPRRLMARQSGDGAAGVAAVTVAVIREHPGLSSPRNAVSGRLEAASRADEARVAWVSGRSRQGGEWLEVTLARPQRISHVILHPGMRDPFAYEIQVRRGEGPWTAVAHGETEASAGAPPPAEHAVGGVEATAVRLLLSGAKRQVSVRGLEIFNTDGVDVAALPSLASASASSSERNVQVVNTAAFAQGFDLNPSYFRLDPRSTTFQAVSPVPGFFAVDPRLVESVRHAEREGARSWVVLSAPGGHGGRPTSRHFRRYCEHLARALRGVAVWEIDGDRKQARAAMAAVRGVWPRAEFAVSEELGLPSARFAVASAEAVPADPRRATLLVHRPFPSRRQASDATALTRWLKACLGREGVLPCVSLLPEEGLLDAWDDPMYAFYALRAFNTVLAGARPSTPHGVLGPALSAAHLSGPGGRFMVVEKAAGPDRAPETVRLREGAGEAWWIDPLTSTSRRLLLEEDTLRGLLFPEHPVILRLG